MSADLVTSTLLLAAAARLYGELEQGEGPYLLTLAADKLTRLTRELEEAREALTIADTTAANLHDVIRERDRELEEARGRERALPKTVDGVPIVPGMVLWRDYFGARWEARVVFVSSTTVSVHHTDEAQDRIMPARIRDVNPGKWYALATPEEASE